jgi:hypothetical protein
VRRFFGATLVTAIVLAAPPPYAQARIAIEPLREILHRASDDLRACASAHRLPEGRYLVRLVIDPTGKAERVDIDESPAPLGLAAASCIEAAFTRLAFPTYARPAAEPARIRVHGRDVRVPPPLTRTRRVGSITIVWPFTIATNGASRSPGSAHRDSPRSAARAPRHPGAVGG